MLKLRCLRVPMSNLRPPVSVKLLLQSDTSFYLADIVSSHFRGLVKIYIGAQYAELVSTSFCYKFCCYFDAQTIA